MRTGKPDTDEVMFLLFVSPSFLFLFLPAALAVYALIPQKARRYALLVFNLAFYALVCRHEPISLILVLLTAAFTYSAGFLIAVTHRRRTVFFSAVILGIAFLTYRLFQHYALLLDDPYYPIGSSIYLLSSVSYLIDIYRNDAPHAKNIADLLLYMLFFPTILVGPVIKYKDFGAMIEGITLSLENFSEGVKRYMAGFLKRIALSAVMGYALQQVAADARDTFGVWLALICLLLQLGSIWFAIAGYYDMACGLMLMFGIRASVEEDSVLGVFRVFSRWGGDYLINPILRQRRLPRRLRYALASCVVCMAPILWLKTRWYLLPIGLLPLLGCLFLCITARRRKGRSIWSRRAVRLLSAAVLLVLLLILLAMLPVERPEQITLALQSMRDIDFTLPLQTELLGLAVLKYLPVALLGVFAIPFVGEVSGWRRRLPGRLRTALQIPALLIAMFCFIFTIVHLMPQFPDCAVSVLPFIVL